MNATVVAAIIVTSQIQQDIFVTVNVAVKNRQDVGVAIVTFDVVATAVTLQIQLNIFASPPKLTNITLRIILADLRTRKSGLQSTGANLINILGAYLGA